MADRSEWEHDIVMLKVAFVHEPSRVSETSSIRFTLQDLQDGLPRHELVSELAYDEVFASAASGAAEPQGTPLSEPRLPATFIRTCQRWFRQNSAAGTPLWIFLVKPYGPLRLVPWEKLLGPALATPILMLPEVDVPSRRRPGARLEIAVCASTPPGQDRMPTARAVTLVVGQLMRLDSRLRPKLHVFTDTGIGKLLKELAGQYGWNDRKIVLYPPLPAVDPVDAAEQGEVLRTPWLSWMRDSLTDTAIDVAHFVCYGHLARQRGNVILARSPARQDKDAMADLAGSTELQTFLTQIGAWSVVFSSMRDERSDLAFRALADSIAQSRPGPVMVHAFREDPDGAALGKGYDFLYGTRQSTAPSSSALRIYCEPHASATALPTAAVFSGRNELRHMTQFALAAHRIPILDTFVFDGGRESLADRLAGTARKPASPVMAATERYVEAVQLRQQRLVNDLSETLSETVDRNIRIERDTLEKLQSAVADLENSPRYKDKGGRP